MFLTSETEEVFREHIFCHRRRKGESVKDKTLGQWLGKSQPFCAFSQEHFWKQLSRGFGLMGVFLPEPGLPTGYPEFLIR